MPFVQRHRIGEEEEGEATGLSLDLEERACPSCRRFLHPWQDACPEDGAPAVPRTALPTARPPAHLLADPYEDEE